MVAGDSPRDCARMAMAPERPEARTKTIARPPKARRRLARFPSWLAGSPLPTPASVPSPETENWISESAPRRALGIHHFHTNWCDGFAIGGQVFHLGYQPQCGGCGGG